MKYIVPFLIGTVTSEMYFIWFDRMSLHTRLTSPASFGDALIFLFKGMKEFHPDIGGKSFEVPVCYLLINIVLALIIGGHAVKDLHGFGKNRLLRYAGRLRWWVTSCIWNVCSVCIYYTLLYAGVVMICIFHYDNFDVSGIGQVIGIHDNAVRVMLSSEITGNVDTQQLFLMIIILPVVTSIAISLLQMTMEFIVLPSVSFIVVMVIYITSAFYMKWFMPGNYMMAYRMIPVNCDGISFGISLIFDIVISVVSVFVGYMFFRKYDVI